ncbi:hypothetical protein JXM67_04555, partial [candidate division WOR-3 bacterium]|nr:hypothetical protein [candidate division WOR-3 bacterium]
EVATSEDDAVVSIELTEIATSEDDAVVSRERRESQVSLWGERPSKKALVEAIYEFGQTGVYLRFASVYPRHSCGLWFLSSF